MAIAKKPVSGRKDIAKKADLFIKGADKKTRKVVEKDRRTPILIRIPPDVLESIDEAAATRGISRAAWIVATATRALESGDW